MAKKRSITTKTGNNMASTITFTPKDNLKQIFDKVHRVYYFPDSSKSFSEQVDGIEFPVLEDGVTFDTGEPEKNEVKLTDGTTWTSKVSQGESDITFQVSSVHSTINDLLMEKKTSASISSVEFEGFTYSGSGYSLAPKKISGALLMVSSDFKSGVYLPNVEIFASFNGEGGDDSTGYYNVSVTPLTDANGAAFYLLGGTKV